MLSERVIPLGISAVTRIAETFSSANQGTRTCATGESHLSISIIKPAVLAATYALFFAAQLDKSSLFRRIIMDANVNACSLPVAVSFVVRVTSKSTAIRVHQKITFTVTTLISSAPISDTSFNTI